MLKGFTDSSERMRSGTNPWFHHANSTWFMNSLCRGNIN